MDTYQSDDAVDNDNYATKEDLYGLEVRLLKRLGELEQGMQKAITDVYREMHMQTYRIIGAIIAAATLAVLISRVHP
ncbi:MAG: hypothetical protein ACXU8N_16025 [Telluria sp.]